MSVFANIKPPKVIYKTESKYNGVIEVLESADSNRQVRVGGFVQSVCENTSSGKKRIWGKVAEVLRENATGIQNILVLGLGGGTMQRFISQEFPDVYITSIEIDPEMVAVAKQFFNLDTIPNHTVLVADACRVVIEPEEFGLAPASFDAAVVDIFKGDEFPELVNSGNFLVALKKLVKPKSFVVFNRIYFGRHQHDANSFIELLENFFTDVTSEAVAGYTNSDNVVIYGRA